MKNTTGIKDFSDITEGAFNNMTAIPPSLFNAVTSAEFLADAEFPDIDTSLIVNMAKYFKEDC